MKKTIMQYLKKIQLIITWPYRKWREHRAFKKRLKELREKDPYIYK